MFRKLLCSMVVLTLGIGFAAADEFNVLITKVGDGKVSFFKTKKGAKEGDEMTLPVAKDAKVVYGTAKKGKFTPGDAVEGGLKSDVLAKIGAKGLSGHITTDADNKSVTQIGVTKKK